MVDLRKDPRVIASAHKHLLPGEHVLWAARHPAIGKRSLLQAAIIMLSLLVIVGIMTLIASGDFKAYPAIAVFILVFFSPQLTLRTLEMMSRQFLVTDRRVIFVSAFWPFRSSYCNHAELDVHWISFGKGRNVIHLKPFARGIPAFYWRHAVYPDHIENIPDIEAVRETILAQIARNPAPVEEKARLSRSRRPSVPGTRTVDTWTGPDRHSLRLITSR